MIPCSSPQLLQNPLHPVSQMETSHLHNPPCHLNCPIPTVSPLELVLSRLISFELSVFASKVKAFYNCRKSFVRKTLPTTPVNTFYTLQDLNYRFLDYLGSEPLSKSIFGSAVCTLARGSTVRSLRSSVASSSLGRGWVAPPLNQAAAKIKAMPYALQIVENNQAIVPNMKKSTFMQQ